MKRLSLLSIFAFLSVALFFTSCESDPSTGGGGGGGGGIGTGDPATLFLAEEPGFISSSADVDPSTQFKVRLNATSGDSPMNGLNIFEDGIHIDASRILLNDDQAVANPLAILGDDKTSLIWDLTITSHDALDTRNYTFSIVDEAGEIGEVNLLVTTTGETFDPAVSVGGSGNFSIEAGMLISVPITAAQGTYALSSIAVYENDILMDPGRLSYNETDFDSNPFGIPEADQAGFDSSIVIRSNTAEGTYTYRVVVADEFGNSSESTFDITSTPTGTAVSLLPGKLLNAAGPPGTGGMDLDTGNGDIGSSDASAEVKDEGIDLNSPIDANWFRRISGVNGTELRSLFASVNGLPESFTFGGIQFKEELADLWGLSTSFSDVNANGELVSFLVEVGDVFIAKKGDTYYTFEIIEVNETPDDNNDNYIVDIKL